MIRDVCGRYTLTTVDGPALAERFGADPGLGLEAATLGRFNVCPTEPVAAVAADDGVPAFHALRWGLVPPWARRLGAGPEPINARMETVTQRRPFAALVARPPKRCLVLADGWYEWLRPERRGEPRVPFRYTVDGGRPFAFAGLWDVARVGERSVASAAILTTAANEVCAPVHDRMPCVLPGPEEEAAWLREDLAPEDLLELLAPLESARTSAAPANPAVNRAGVEGPELLLAPAEPPGAAPQLALVL